MKGSHFKWLQKSTHKWNGMKIGYGSIYLFNFYAHSLGQIHYSNNFDHKHLNFISKSFKISDSRHYKNIHCDNIIRSSSAIRTSPSSVISDLKCMQMILKGWFTQHKKEKLELYINNLNVSKTSIFWSGHFNLLYNTKMTLESHHQTIPVQTCNWEGKLNNLSPPRG